MLGIGFRGLTASDFAAAASGDGSLGSLSKEFVWEMGVKRVATHNMFTDLLVGYGAIGALIYYSLLLALVILTTHICFSLSTHSVHMDLAIVTAGLLWIQITIANMAGSFMYIRTIFIVIILICALYQHQNPALQKQQV